MVKITMEFPSIDAAIVALGKLTKADGTVLVEGKPRKGRSDAGKPRKNAKGAGERKEGDANSPAASPAPEAPKAGAAAKAPGAKGASSAPSTTAETAAATEASAPAPSADVAQKALEKLFEAAPPAGGLEGARAVLSRFGVTRVRDLAEDQRAEFIALTEKVLAGGAV